jgi:conjugative transfer region protein (TIGR03750 family)
MVLNHINHKMPIYKDCTLFELLTVSGAYLLIGGLTFSSLTWLLFDYASIGWAIILLSFVHVTRFLLGRLQRVKYGKPYGYYQQLFLKKLNQFPLMRIFWKSPLVTKEICWSIRREIL